MLSSIEQAFVGRDENRAPLKTPAWEASYHCDNSDFDFCITEHNELPVIKICSDEGRDDCQQLKPKGFFWNYCDNCNNSFYYFNFV